MRLILTILLALLPVTVAAQEPLYTVEGWYGVRTNGNDSTYSQGLSHRYVDGELRFLTLTLQRHLHEFTLPDPGGVRQSTTATWDLSGTGAFRAGFHGIWFEQAKNRLWITSAEDYTATNHPARVTLVELGSNGTVRVLKQFFLDKPAKRVYGGCQAVPASLVAQIGGPYVCGWGGYTSLVMDGGNASVGPTMYAIPDPDTIANGATVPARTILDASTYQSARGVRLTLPDNDFDAAFQSPNADGLGWMVMGDSYYNTGFWIGTTFGAVASLCEGRCWYQDSTLWFDGRQFELHLWDGARLDGTDRLTRPDRMVELDVPRGRTSSGKMGNTTVNNVAGATYDPVSGKLYAIGFAQHDPYTARLYQIALTLDGEAPTEPEGPEDPQDPEDPTEPCACVGERGPQGPQGPPGPRGPQGAPGRDGISGRFSGEIVRLAGEREPPPGTVLIGREVLAPGFVITIVRVE